MFSRYLACAVVVLSLPLAALAQNGAKKDWPQWRGPQRDGSSAETGLLKEWPKGGPKLLWNSKDANKDPKSKKEKNIGSAWSSIAIVGDRIYTMGDQGSQCFVHCLDKSNGKILWSTHIGGTRGDGGPRCTPTVDGDRVYGISNAGQLACLDAAKGEVLWSKDFVKDFGGKWMAGWFFCESPLVDGDKLVCTPGADDAGLVALDKKTGDLIWKSAIPGSGGCGYASIVVAEVGGIRQYVTLMGGGKLGGLVGVEAKSGKLLWNYRRIANGTGNIPTPIVKDDLIFTSTGYGTGAALIQLVPEKDGGVKAVEKYFLNGRTLQNHHGQMILVGDYIYGGHGHNDGQPFCLHMASGKFAWDPQRDHPGSGSAAVAYADGHMYFRWQDNVLGLVETSPSEYHLKGTFSLPGNLGTGWQHPVILDGKMYIRGRDQLLCYDVRGQ